MLSDGCAAFVAAHACGEAKHDAALAMIKAALPVITSIDWERVPSRLEVPGVGRERLAQAIASGIADFYAAQAASGVQPPVTRTR